MSRSGPRVLDQILECCSVSKKMPYVLLACLLLLCPLSVRAQTDKKDAEPNSVRSENPLGAKVGAIPDDVVNRYKLDTSFYKKHLDYKGFSIISSAKVSDDGLYEARYL